MTSLHFHPLRVRAVQPDTEEAVIVSFELPDALRDAFQYQPGQYLTLRQTIAGEDLRRSYSICAGAGDAELRVGVRRVAGGRFSNWLNDALHAGDTLDVMPPQGRFGAALQVEGEGGAPAAQSAGLAAAAAAESASAGPAARCGRHYLGLAGGSGITPILSIMKTVLAREPGSRFTLIYGNRRQASTMFKEELEDLKNQYLTRLALHHVFSDEVTDSPLQAGLLDRTKVGQFLATLIDPAGISHAFVCGPYQMNDEAEAALLAAGVAAERIHIERFGAPLANPTEALQHQARPEDAEAARVVVVRDGLSREVEYRKSNTSLLDAIAAAGLEAPFSCKSGVCATCRARVLEGQVRMDRNFSLEPADLAAGFVLTCQAHPLSERVVISYDDR